MLGSLLIRILADLVLDSASNTRRSFDSEVSQLLPGAEVPHASSAVTAGSLASRSAPRAGRLRGRP